MTRQEVYGVIETMANGQGFYGRLLSRLNEVSEETANGFLDSFADCKDVADVLMFMEG
ncbi:MAG: hypothetical protein PHW45_04185 [Candidatus ainarchaeum sp.]|nr:hypothetical protein [Candidatus ainarchaeum sp.]